MDRRNGGDPLAPPRPPKLLPRVHRPRAAEPPMMSAPPTPVQQQQQQQQQQQLCTNNHLSSRSINHNNNNNATPIINSSNRLNNTIVNSRNSNNNNSSNSSSSATHLTTPLLQLHHHQQPLQQQHQHPHNTTISLNRNNSNISSASSTSSVATTVSSVNSFTRRRPPPPIAVTGTSSPIPILPLQGASLNLNLLNNNIINSIEPVPVSPVTLAAPRPESERLTNEYVDTPFRTAQQLQEASRNQHPAGQHINGQTTTQHNLLLLLLQRSQRQQQQQQQNQQQQQQQHHSSHHQSSGSHSNASSGVVGTCLGSAPAATIHSNSRSLKGDATGGTGPTTGTMGDGAPQATQTTPASATLATSPPTITRIQQHHRPNALPITQPITKQPASATFKKDPPASLYHEEALDLHHIGGGGVSGGGTGTGGLGSPLGGIILGDGALNPITCPRCDRCRCEQCQSPRQLPQTWVCNKTCLCSAETIIDYASCLCCVKALFYHCAKDHEMECDDGDTTLCVDDPWSCLPHKRTQRWGWLGALSLVLPCLWCYWPMRGCVAVCEKCYARHAGHGCRCQTIGSTSSMSPIVNIGGGSAGGSNATNGGTKSSGVSGGVHSGISGSGNGHHHHHHGANSGGGGNAGESSAARILRKCDITPEKRLLDSSPEY